MKRFAIALLLTTLLPVCLRADSADEYLEAQMKAHRIPGLALRVIKNGAPVKTGAYGLANLELQTPVTPETVFEIGSVTKQFTAAGILLLVQEGKFSLDDPISRHLPGTPEAWAPVTVRNLLTHTSGIKSYTGLDGYALTLKQTQDQFIKKLGAHPLEFTPGSAWKYSNSGYSLLGYIIENTSGRPYWAFMRERIFQPLGMNSTTDRLPQTVIPNRASGYEQTTNHIWINRDYDVTDVFSAGAIVSTIGDLTQWNVALDGNRLLMDESKRQMWTPFRLSNGKSTDYGFGWRIGTFDEHLNIGHSGSTSGFSATFQRFPGDKLTVIILTNTDEQIATELARKVAKYYF